MLDWPGKSPDLNILENFWGIWLRRYMKEVVSLTTGGLFKRQLWVLGTTLMYSTFRLYTNLYLQGLDVWSKTKFVSPITEVKLDILSRVAMLFYRCCHILLNIYF